MAKNILIIDDDKDLAGTLAKVFVNKGYNVTEAYNGAEGLKKALSIKPDLIIMDVMMETDTAGFEIANQIRSKRPFSKYKDIKDTPIIIITSIHQFTNSRFSMDDKNNFLPDLNGFLTKPVNIDVLLAKVKEILQ